MTPARNPRSRLRANPETLRQNAAKPAQKTYRRLDQPATSTREIQLKSKTGCLKIVDTLRSAFLCTERARNSVLHGLATRLELALRLLRRPWPRGALVNEHCRLVESRFLHPFPAAASNVRLTHAGPIRLTSADLVENVRLARFEQRDDAWQYDSLAFRSPV